MHQMHLSQQQQAPPPETHQPQQAHQSQPPQHHHQQQQQQQHWPPRGAESNATASSRASSVISEDFDEDAEEEREIEILAALQAREAHEMQRRHLNELKIKREIIQRKKLERVQSKSLLGGSGGSSNSSINGDVGHPPGSQPREVAQAQAQHGGPGGPTPQTQGGFPPPIPPPGSTPPSSPAFHAGPHASSFAQQQPQFAHTQQQWEAAHAQQQMQMQQQQMQQQHAPQTAHFQSTTRNSVDGAGPRPMAMINGSGGGSGGGNVDRVGLAGPGASYQSATTSQHLGGSAALPPFAPNAASGLDARQPAAAGAVASMSRSASIDWASGNGSAQGSGDESEGGRGNPTRDVDKEAKKAAAKEKMMAMEASALSGFSGSLGGEGKKDKDGGKKDPGSKDGETGMRR